MNCLSVFSLQKSLRGFNSKQQSGASYLNSESFTDLKNYLLPKSSDNYCKYRLRLSLRAPEGCVAISSKKVRLLRFTRNDNSYSWTWVLMDGIDDSISADTACSHASGIVK
jgi:hypothetical protein